MIIELDDDGNVTLKFHRPLHQHEAHAHRECGCHGKRERVEVRFRHDGGARAAEVAVLQNEYYGKDGACQKKGT